LYFKQKRKSGEPEKKRGFGTERDVSPTKPL
jgi:hypothetical protein